MLIAAWSVSAASPDDCRRGYTTVQMLAKSHEDAPLPLGGSSFTAHLPPNMKLEEFLARNPFHDNFLHGIGVDFAIPDNSFVTTRSLVEHYNLTVDEWVRTGRLREDEVIRLGGIFLDHSTGRMVVHSLSEVEPPSYRVPINDYIKLRLQIRGEALGLFPMGRIGGYIKHDFGHASALLRDADFMRARRKGAEAFNGSELDRVVALVDRNWAMEDERALANAFKSRYLLATEWLVHFPPESLPEFQQIARFPAWFDWHDPTVDLATVRAHVRERFRTKPSDLGRAVAEVVDFHRHHAVALGGASNDLYNPLVKSQGIMEQPEATKAWFSFTLEPVVDALNLMRKEGAFRAGTERARTAECLLTRAYQWILASQKLTPVEWVEGAYATGKPGGERLNALIKQGRLLDNPCVP